MTKDKLIELLQRYFDEPGCRFGAVQNKKSQRGDLHAMILLDHIVPGAVESSDYGAPDMVAGAEHDQIWLATDMEVLAPLITEEQVRELACCGVYYDGEGDGLSMFV